MAESGSMSGIPFITTDQMREVDRAMIEDYAIMLLQMMENAGRELADLARTRFLDSDPRGRRVEVLAGPGGNGGGGLVCARRLLGWGADVSVRMSVDATRLTDAARHQHDILRRFGVPIRTPGDNAGLGPADLIVDALIGYSLRGAPRGEAATLIRQANAADAPVLALDVPSGIDAASGDIHDPSISAQATMTLALPKVGLHGAAARKQVGELYLADVGVPRELYEQPPLNLTVGPIFAREGVVRLW
ncbi:MAG: NAD(P)H-hydrate epimerase [SAR202 cluster bacterium]|jgi:NAD(P)H-hydrate epimerase|nr:NAD(P)H-hydrate epimerase [SAR202 cluster bacterium]